MILFFGCISCGFKHNHNKPYRHWRQDGGWHALPIVTHATAWRRELLLYTSRRQGQPLQFRAKNPRSHVIIVNNIPALVRMMTWRREGDKSLSEPMIVCLLMHECITLPQWVKSNTVDHIIIKPQWVNSSPPPSATYMRLGIGSALVQIMACRLFGAKPLSKPMLGYCQLDP